MFRAASGRSSWRRSSPNETVRGAVAVMRNVTEESKLEKLRRDFVANVSHEMRTPLSMLQGYSEALLDDIAASPEERQGARAGHL